MVSRRYIVAALALVLLIWGPIDHESPWGLAVRICYLVSVPLVVWFGLGWVWGKWKPDEALEDRVQRTLEGMTAGVTAGVMLAWIGVRLEDGYQRLEDTDAVFFQVIFGAFFFYLSVSKRENQ